MPPEDPRDDGRHRCGWAMNSAIECHYHDHEWGKPCYDDRELFEFLVLEGHQAGLSWRTVLQKRDRYRELFDDFDPELVARFTDDRLEQILLDPGVIRNRQKIYAARTNAWAFLQLQEEWGSFSDYLWSLTQGKPLLNRPESDSDVPANTALSDQLSKDLKHHGFTFVGSTICYAYLQATGVINDHTTGCFLAPEARLDTPLD